MNISEHVAVSYQGNNANANYGMLFNGSLCCRHLAWDFCPSSFFLDVVSAVGMESFPHPISWNGLRFTFVMYLLSLSPAVGWPPLTHAALRISATADWLKHAVASWSPTTQAQLLSFHFLISISVSSSSTFFSPLPSLSISLSVFPKWTEDHNVRRRRPPSHPDAHRWCTSCQRQQRGAALQTARYDLTTCYDKYILQPLVKMNELINQMFIYRALFICLNAAQNALQFKALCEEKILILHIWVKQLDRKLQKMVQEEKNIKVDFTICEWHF